MTSPRDPSREADAQEGLLSVTAAAQLTGLSRSTISSWITGGKLPAVRLAGRRYVTREHLLATQATAHLGAVVPAWRQDPAHAGRRLRALREAAGLNQLQLAAASGLTHEAISRLETGHYAPYATRCAPSPRRWGWTPRASSAARPSASTMLTTAEAAFRLDVPIGRVRTWVQAGGASWGESVRAVAGAGGGGGGAGSQWSPARRESPPRSALSRLTGAGGGG